MSQLPGTGPSGPQFRFYNSHLRLRYNYDPYRDEIVYENGLRTPRPPQVPVETLTAASAAPHTPRTPYQHRQQQSYPYSNTSQSYSWAPAPSNHSASGPSHSALTHQPPRPPTFQPGYSSSPGASNQRSHNSLEAAFGQLSLNGSGVRVTRQRRTSRGLVPQVYTTPAAIKSGGSDDGVDEQKLYSSFKRKKAPRKFFGIGKVFLTLWSEPAGDSAHAAGSTYTAITSNNDNNNSGYSQGRFGEEVYSKIRRFIVVREGHESCTCLPIVTYRGQGVARRGVRKRDHAIIHTGKDAPKPTAHEAPVRGEDGMQPRAIRIDVDEKTEKLDDMSRVDFGKVYTIEHKAKVKSLGKINRDSMQPLLYQLKAVWANTIGISPQQAMEDPRGRAHSSVAEWINAYQALVTHGFSDERARAMLRAQPQRLQRVRSDTMAEHEDNENEEDEDVDVEEGAEQSERDSD